MLGQGSTEFKRENKPHLAGRRSWLGSASNSNLGRFLGVNAQTTGNRWSRCQREFGLVSASTLG